MFVLSYFYPTSLKSQGNARSRGTILCSTWVRSCFTLKYKTTLKNLPGTNALAYFSVGIRDEEKISFVALLLGHISQRLPDMPLKLHVHEPLEGPQGPAAST